MAVVPRVSLYTYLTDQGLDLQPAGPSCWKLCCPFHAERTPSCYLWENAPAVVAATGQPDRLHCFGCPEQRVLAVDGDPSQLVMVKGNHWADVVDVLWQLEFPTDRTKERAFARARALHLIGEGTTAPTTPRRRRAPGDEPESLLPPPTPHEQLALTLASLYWRERLQDQHVGRPARDYFLHERRVSGPLTEALLRHAGWMPSAFVYRHGKAELLERLALVPDQDPVALATKIGALTPEGKLRLWDRVFFFCTTPGGSVVFYQARALSAGNRAKFLNPAFPRVPYAPLPADAMAYAGTHLVEGAQDAWAFAANEYYAVSLLGKRLPSLAYLRRLPPPLYDFLDEDAAGQEASATLQLLARDHGLDVRRGRHFPGIKDAAAWLETVGPVAFRHGVDQVRAVADATAAGDPPSSVLRRQP